MPSPLAERTNTMSSLNESSASRKSRLMAWKASRENAYSGQHQPVKSAPRSDCVRLRLLRERHENMMSPTFRQQLPSRRASITTSLSASVSALVSSTAPVERRLSFGSCTQQSSLVEGSASILLADPFDSSLPCITPVADSDEDAAELSLEGTPPLSVVMDADESSALDPLSGSVSPTYSPLLSVSSPDLSPLGVGVGSPSSSSSSSPLAAAVLAPVAVRTWKQGIVLACAAALVAASQLHPTTAMLGHHAVPVADLPVRFDQCHAAQPADTCTPLLLPWWWVGSEVAVDVQVQQAAQQEDLLALLVVGLGMACLAMAVRVGVALLTAAADRRVALESEEEEESEEYGSEYESEEGEYGEEDFAAYPDEAAAVAVLAPSAVAYPSPGQWLDLTFSEADSVLLEAEAAAAAEARDSTAPQLGSFDLPVPESFESLEVASPGPPVRRSRRVQSKR